MSKALSVPVASALSGWPFQAWNLYPVIQLGWGWSGPQYSGSASSGVEHSPCGWRLGGWEEPPAALSWKVASTIQSWVGGWEAMVIFSFWGETSVLDWELRGKRTPSSWPYVSQWNLSCWRGPGASRTWLKCHRILPFLERFNRCYE